MAYEIAEENKAVVVFMEMMATSYGSTMQEVRRVTVNTDRHSTAVAWAKTYRGPLQGFVVMLSNRIIAMEMPPQQ